MQCIHSHPPQLYHFTPQHQTLTRRRGRSVQAAECERDADLRQDFVSPLLRLAIDQH